LLSPEKTVEMLSEFGLTRNQAKVYIAVAQLGLAPVGQISKLSKVRREDVYRVLPKLEKMGLVEKLLGMPAKIRAIPLEEALSVLIKHEQEIADNKVSTLKARTQELLKYFNSNKGKPQPKEEESSFALLSEQDVILGRALAMIKAAKREVDIVYSRTRLMQFLSSFSEQIRKTINKGSKIRIISEIPEYGNSIPRVIEEYLSPKNSVDLRYTELPSCHYIIADFKQALIATVTEGNMGQYPALWTNNDSLVSILQGNFEELWQNSLSWKTIETTAVPEKVARFMQELRPSNHVIFVYDSADAKHNVLFSYLKAGLDKGEAAVYVASEENPAQITDAMKRFGIKVEKYRKTGALQVLESSDIYIIEGKFNIPTTLNLWKKLYDETLERGFKGLRVTGEMACFFKLNLIQDLIEYERALHRVLDIPMIAVCAYNSSMLNKINDPINLYTELIRAHGTVLFAGIDNKLGKIEIRKAQHLEEA
jgi:sugar-specific transcriptional regulator TrmB